MLWYQGYRVQATRNVEGIIVNDIIKLLHM
jgi:hypothetical protein